MKYFSAGLLALLALQTSPAIADTLADWAQSYDQPQTQRKLLVKIFSDQIGSVGSAVADKQNGTYFFTNNSKWVRLGKDSVWGSTDSFKSPFLIVTCMLYQSIDKEPLAATSYLFRDTLQQAKILTGGYSTHERLHLVKLPKLGKWFLVVADSAASPSGAMRQWSMFLFGVDTAGIRDQPPNAWSSPPQFHSFQLGFTVLNGTKESLVVRTVPPPSPTTSFIDYASMNTSVPDMQYAAYSWTGDRFEADDSVFESNLRTLPESVWKYGTGR